MRLAFHDGCTLGRKFGIGDEIRDLARMVPGVEIVEMIHPNEGMGGTDHKDWSTCPGAWLYMLLPEFAPLLGANVIENEILPLNVHAVSSTCANAVVAFAGAIMQNKYPIRPMFLTELLNEAWR